MLNENIDKVVGSRLGVKGSELRKQFSLLAKHVESVMTDVSVPLYEKHNVYTSYSILILGYATGHRPVHDVYCFRDDICLSVGLLAINDKVSSSATETRIVWLSDTAKKQIAHYLKHLDQLSKELYCNQYNNDLAGMIASVLQPVASNLQSIPLFFYLTNDYRLIRARPASLVANLGFEWPYVANHNRHFLETGLKEENTPVPLIDLILGHQQEFNHYLGGNSSWSADEAGKIAREHIESLINKVGISHLAGLRSDIDGSVPLYKGRPNELYGHLRRSVTRERKYKALESIVRRYMNEEVAKVGGLSAFLSDKNNEDRTLVRLVDEVVPVGYSKKDAIVIAVGFVNEAAKEDAAVKYSPKRLMEAEKGPFDAGWMRKYRNASDVRDRFIDDVVRAGCGQRNESVEDAWAYVVFSAVAVTGMHRPEWVQYLLDVGPNRLSKIKKWVYFVDIWSRTTKPQKHAESYAPDWRWHPDSFSKSLILHLFRAFKKTEIKRYSSSKASLCFDELIEAFGMKSTSGKSVVRICRLFEPYWRYHFPVYINNIFRGKQHNTPLPKRTLARLLYGTKLSSGVSSESNKYEILVRNKPGSEVVDSYGYYSLVSRILKLAESVSGTTSHNANAVQRKYIQTEVHKLHEEYYLGGVAEQLSTWLIHMCRYGVTRERKPAVRTIKTYFGWIAKPLMLLMQNRHMDEIGMDELNRIYKTIINYRSSRSETAKDMRHDVLRELMNFHECIERYGTADVDDLDWEYIAEGIDYSGLPRPNANIVTPREYEHSLWLIRKRMIGDDEYSRVWPAIVLILGYRFGLRIGEIRRLRLQDIQLFNGELWVLIQNTSKGRTKTKSSVRQLPLVGDLSDIERNILESHLSIMREKRGLGPCALLLPGFGTDDGMLDAGHIRSNIHSLLKHVTGDSRIVFHHLRHSFITLQYLNNFMPLGYRVKSQISSDLLNATNDPCEVILGESVRNIYRQHALSRCAGHKDISTSIHSYIHVVDDIATAYAEQAPMKSLGIQALSKITGLNERTLHNRFKNAKGISLNSIRVMNALNTIQLGDEVQKYNFKLEKFPKKFVFETPKTLPLLVSWHKGLVDHLLYGDSVVAAAYMNGVAPVDLHALGDIAKSISLENMFDGYVSAEGFGYTKKAKAEYHNDVLDHVFGELELMLGGDESREVLMLAAKIWRRAYRKDEIGDCLLITTADDLNKVITASSMLGIAADRFVAIKHPRFYELNSKNEHKESISLEDVKREGIQATDIKPIRAMDRGTGVTRYDFIRLSTIKAKGKRYHLGSIKTLSYILHMTLVWDEFVMCKS